MSEILKPNAVWKSSGDSKRPSPEESLEIGTPDDYRKCWKWVTELNIELTPDAESFLDFFGAIKHCKSGETIVIQETAARLVQKLRISGLITVTGDETEFSVFLFSFECFIRILKNGIHEADAFQRLEPFTDEARESYVILAQYFNVVKER